MRDFYIVDKKNIDRIEVFCNSLAIQDGRMFSFSPDKETCYVSYPWLGGAKGNFVETEDYNFCAVEAPVWYA